MDLTYVDCQSFAGGFTLGATQAGMKLVHKVEDKGGFGMANCEANRHLLGSDWTSQATVPEAWEPVAAHAVFGNPPCSGFSALSPASFRGVNSKVNACMFNLIDYASRVNPYVVVFESVQQAYSNGRPLMQVLRDRLATLTGHHWDLYHVKHDAYLLGGCAIRKRYFFVASRIPFGVEKPDPLIRRPTLMDAIGDLEGLGDTWEQQPYRKPPSWWLNGTRRPDAVVDGHKIEWNPYVRRALDLLREGETWGYREDLPTVAKRFYERTGRLPESWHAQYDRLLARDFFMGYNNMTRWHPYLPGRVITGGALNLALHPFENRPFTHREAARIMGFPDDWLVHPLRRVSGLRMTWGKGITTVCGRWIASWVKRSLEGQPGTYLGDEIGDCERLIDVGKEPKTRAA